MIHDDLSRLREKLGTSFYLLDVGKLEDNFRNFYRAFASRYEKVIIGYSYKTNYLPYLCKTLHKLGAYAEVVSGLEYELAEKLEVPPNQMIVNGPLKTYEEMERAILNGSIVNLDSFYEIGHLRRISAVNPGRQIKVGLRINFNLHPDDDSGPQNRVPSSRFGFCLDNGDFQRALCSLREIRNVKVSGLHGHFSTDRSLAAFERITDQLLLLADDFFPDSLDYLDVGGGFYGDVPESFGKNNTPTFDDYADAICSRMNRRWGEAAFSRKPALILEPGISLVANVMKFVCEVVGIKQVRGETFVLVDGSVFTVKPTMHSHPLPVTLVGKNNRNRGRGTYHIVGYTCMEKDYLSIHHTGSIPEQGDFLVYENVGAYTTVFHPPFIRERPPIVAKVNDSYLTVRNRESVESFFDERLYVFSP